MYSTDLSPNRLTRARYKAVDLLDNINEGEIGLIAYAGDAFIISPLTEDINNIKLLLPSLSPDLMPELGSDPMRALLLADEMLKNAGHVEGDIYWFTDGIENSEIQDITEWSREHNYRLNILGVGTKNGSPIKLSNGEFMKDNSGAIVVPKLRANALKGVAQRGKGQYTSLQNNNSDIQILLKSNQLKNTKEEQQKESSNTGDQWQEAGPYLVLIILPFVLIYFRRGRLIAFLPFILFLTPAEQSYANVWDNLWKTKNQQAQEKFDQAQYEEAAQQFKNPLWQGSAHYKAGNFEEALKSFQQSDSAEALYNQGNALAKLNKLDEAIKSYENALKKNPELESAKANKALLEQLKKQQEQQQQSDQNQQDDNQQQGDEQQSDQESQNSQESDQNQDQQNDQSEQSQDGQSQDNQQSDQQNSESNNNENSENNAEQEAEQNQSESDENQNENDEEQSQQSQEQEAQANDEQTEEQKAQALQAADKLAQEAEQKHQQILNKVTDDPYQLLRNKMQLEYKKRRQNRSSLGENKKW
jgi:Ca-activated chloride channel homolog